MLLNRIVIFLVLFLGKNALALDPVTGAWVDTTDVQKRTGYSIEVQNNFMVLSMYTYSKNKATQDPTWYNAGGFLTQNADGTASGTFDLYNVNNNQLPGTSANSYAGSMSIVFKNRETASIRWHNFPGHSQKESMIKKFWFLGTGTVASAKRIAAAGDWVYSVFNNQTGQSSVFIVEYFDPLTYPEKYTDAANNVLFGSSNGTDTNVVKWFYDDGWDVTVIRDASVDYYIDCIGGGVDYGDGSAAVVTRGAEPKDDDYSLYSTSVRLSSVDGLSKNVIGRSLSKNISNQPIEELMRLEKNLRKKN